MKSNVHKSSTQPSLKTERSAYLNRLSRDRTIGVLAIIIGALPVALLFAMLLGPNDGGGLAAVFLAPFFMPFFVVLGFGIIFTSVRGTQLKKQRELSNTQPDPVSWKSRVYLTIAVAAALVGIGIFLKLFVIDWFMPVVD